MANQEHLNVLKQGVEMWNQWRQEHLDMQPDFSYADLRGIVLQPPIRTNNSKFPLIKVQLSNANFTGANLTGAFLSQANLCNAHLNGTTLNGATLNGANLAGAELIEANLIGVDFHKACLERAQLNGACLTNALLVQAQLNGTYLNGATLKIAKLENANLNRANLSQADLSSANLKGANLSNVDLSNANLSGANLNRTNFTRAILGSTIFGNTDLSTVKGIETVIHRQPSTLGIDTIYRSDGHIPEIFLKGTGAPDSFITYARSLVGNPIDFYSCFISYSSKNEAFAKRLYADLQSNGVRCWFAPEDLKIGDRIRSRVDESIRLYDKLLLVLSQHSVASQWVEQEVETALEKERKEQRLVLFPIRLDQIVMELEGGWPALIRNTRNIGDFTRWKQHDAYQQTFERLLRDLKTGEKP